MNFKKLFAIMVALWVFYGMKWIALTPGYYMFATALWTMFFVYVFDYVLYLLKVFTKIVTIPLNVITLGLFGLCVDGVFVYLALMFTAWWTGRYTLPAYNGPQWWQALVIGVIVAIIANLTNDKKSKWK